MEGYAKQKVPGGKLLIVKVRFGERIEGVRINGDFFLHPEEKITEIENALLEMPSSSSEQEISDRIKNVVDANYIEMIGITPEAIAQTLKMAVGQRSGE